MKATVYTNRDSAERGPSLDGVPVSHGHYEDETEDRVRLAFTASVPNLDRDATRERVGEALAEKGIELWPEDITDEILDALFGEDQGLWTMVLEMTSDEAIRFGAEVKHLGYQRRIQTHGTPVPSRRTDA